MKKILTFSVACIMLGPNAMAIKKCVQYGSDTTCTSTSSNWLGKVDWEATCTTNGNTEKVYGVATCSVGKSVADGTLLLPTINSATDTTNVNCWCKMTHPAVSPWMFAYESDSASACAYDCASKCASYLSTMKMFRNGMFSNMS